VQRDADERTAIVAKDIERHKRKIKQLADNQARLVQLSYQGPRLGRGLGDRAATLGSREAAGHGLLDAAELHARDIESALDGAPAETKTPHDTYLASKPLERRTPTPFLGARVHTTTNWWAKLVCAQTI
jgi:hypothetical protein